MWLTDIAHHHLSVGVIAIFMGHVYKERSIMYELDELILMIGASMESNFRGSFRGTLHIISNSLHLQLAILPLQRFIYTCN